MDTTITLGQELRRLRARKGISQFDLAVCMGWKGTNPILLMEKDRRIPKPDTLDKLGKCLDLSYIDVHYLNGLAGHVLPTQLPPFEYVIDTLEKIAGVNNANPYPVIVVDYQFRLWLANPAAALLFLGDETQLQRLLVEDQGLLDVMFDSRLDLCSRMDQLDCVRREYVFRFKSGNALRQHEEFFLTLPARMQSLRSEDTEAFNAAWQLIDLNTYYSVRCVHSGDFYYTNLEQGDIRLDFPMGQVAFHVKFEPVLHLNSLFQIVSFVPVSLDQLATIAETYQGKATLKRWELLDDPVGLGQANLATL